MSYEIYKSIKANDDGTFTCVSASSNETDMFGNRPFREWKCDYFRNEWPEATKAECKAIWLLYSVYSGDRFYPSNWRQDQALASKFMHENGYDSETFHKDKALFLEYAREFMEIKKSLRGVHKEEYFVRMDSNSGRAYVKRLNQRSVSLTHWQDEAKVFKVFSLEDLKNKFRGYASYNVEYIKANQGGVKC